MSFPLPETDSCYLCAIVEARPPSWNLLETAELTITVLNGRQFEIGQCMVAPRRHAPTRLDLTEAEEAAVMAAAKRLTRIFLTAYSPDGVLVYQNNGTGSGQEVPHYHLHVVPRRANSNWGLGPPHIARLNSSRRRAFADHSIVTEDKARTAKLLRRHFDS